MRFALVLAIRLGVSVLLLYLAVRTLPDAATWPTAGELHPAWIPLILGLFLCIVLLLSLRLALLAPRATGLRFPRLAAVTWVGLGAGQIGLGLLGSDAARVAVLRRFGTPLGLGTRLIVTDRVVGLLGLAIVVLAGLAAAWRGVLAGLAVTAIVLAALTVLARGLAALCRTTAASGSIARIAGAVAAVADHVTPMPLLLALLGHLLSVAMFLAVALACGYGPPLAATLLAVPAGLLGAALPVSLGGWGVRELAISTAYARLGVAFPEAVAASVSFGLAMAALSLPGLLAILPRRAG